MLNTFTFDGFKIADEYFMSEDCYIVITESKTDNDGDEFDINVEYDLKNGQFSFSKSYDHQVLPCCDLPISERIKIQRYILEKVSKALNESEDGEEDTHKQMDETEIIQGAFYLYILAMNQARGELFFTLRNGKEMVDLVMEAKQWKETTDNNNSQALPQYG